MFESKEDKLYIHTLLYNIGEFPKLYGELMQEKMQDCLKGSKSQFYMKLVYIS